MDASRLLLVPSSSTTRASNTGVRDTANSLGAHDTLRYGQRSLVVDANGTNAHEKRLQNWEETQDNLRLNLQRNLYGMHAPMRQLMERRIVASNPNMPNMQRSNIHLDILMGRDETLEVSDFFGTADTNPYLVTMDHRAAMEKKHHI